MHVRVFNLEKSKIPLAYEDTSRQPDPANARFSIILQQTVRDIQPVSPHLSETTAEPVIIVVDSVTILNLLLPLLLML